jgi:pilus assembly protein CpaF
VVEDEVRELVRRRGIDPAEQPSVVRRLVDEVIADYDERSISGALPPLLDTRSAARAVFDAVAGFGPLQPYLDDPLVEEIWINEPTKVFIARAGAHELTTTVLSEDQVRDLVEKMLKSSGRRVDLSAPFVDAMLPDGSRLHVVIPDITRRFWSVNVRKFVVRASHLDDLVALGSITPAAARFLDAAVRSGLNVLVSVGTQAGKTTIEDLPDDLLRYPTFVPGEGAARWRPWRDALHGWLAEHDLRPTFLELEAERRRRWPIVEKINHAGESKVR